MKRKGLFTVGLAAGLSILASMNAFAAGWQYDENGGWWWQNDDGSYPVSSWQWLDGNGDGVSESYYFDEKGYLAVNTTVDGYTVDQNGCWTVDGAILTKQTGEQQSNADLQRWIGTYAQINSNNPHCNLEVYHVDDTGIMVEYDFAGWNGGGIGVWEGVTQLKFNGADRTSASGVLEVVNDDVSETFTLKEDGSIEVNFVYLEGSTDEWLAFNGTYQKNGTTVKTLAERQEEERQRLALEGYNMDGTLTEEGKAFDHDGNGILDSNESAELMWKHLLESYNAQ